VITREVNAVLAVPATPAPIPAWSLVPEDLTSLGWPRDPGPLFGRLHRVGTWSADGPRLGKEPRRLVEQRLSLELPKISDVRESVDGSRRIVLELGDGARIEAVHMPRDVRNPRVTVCLSTQVGCAMGCSFCATAKMGLVRNLSAAEIVGQLFAVLHRFGPGTPERLALVFMGMGEPLHNVDALMRALDVLCDSRGFGVAPSRVTVSTAGHVSGLDRLARARYLPELAVSVNGATERVRRSLMPIDKRWPLAELRAALARWPKRPHQKITLEYVLLDGVNDSADDADALAAWIGDLRHVANVIPFNAWGDATSPYREPSAERVSGFVARLRSHGCLVKVRRSRGRDVRAACGTLVAS